MRESIGWRLAETAPGRWDFSRAVRCARAAERAGVQIQWTLMHYGTPPDVSLFDDALIPRFARFAAAAADALAPWAAEPPVYTPVNEIGFVAWTVSETNHMHPYRGDPDGRGEVPVAGEPQRLLRAERRAQQRVGADEHDEHQHERAEDRGRQQRRAGGSGGRAREGGGDVQRQRAPEHPGVPLGELDGVPADGGAVRDGQVGVHRATSLTDSSCSDSRVTTRR